MVTNHGRQIISCLPVSPALLSSPDRVGPNSRWCRREARTWDLQISVSLTSVPDRHEQQIPNLKSKFCFWFPHLCYYTYKCMCFMAISNSVFKTGTVCSNIPGDTPTIPYAFIHLHLIWWLLNVSVDGEIYPTSRESSCIMSCILCHQLALYLAPWSGWL